MSNRNQLNATNSLIATGNVQAQSGINSEIYSNIDSVESIAHGNTNSINNILQTALPERDRQISEHRTKLEVLDEKIKNFNTESLKGLSQHFYKNYLEMNDISIEWLVRLIGKKGEKTNIGAMGWGLLIDVILSLLLIYKSNISYLYLLIPYNIVYISLLYFIATQYSHYKRLALDAKNRQVVAESYLAILNNSADRDAKNIITNIVADTLFSRSTVDSGAELPIKEIVRIADNIVSKR